MTSAIALMPSDKYDTERAEALIALGYPAVDPVLPTLLEWMQDLNWPIANVLRPFLVGIGASLAPYVRTVLGTTDDTWKWSLLQGIVMSSPELAESLRPELTRLVESPTPCEVHEEVSQLAQEILARLGA
jgi:hypothetical protein